MLRLPPLPPLLRSLSREPPSSAQIVSRDVAAHPTHQEIGELNGMEREFGVRTCQGNRQKQYGAPAHRYGPEIPGRLVDRLTGSVQAGLLVAVWLDRPAQHDVWRAFRSLERERADGGFRARAVVQAPLAMPAPERRRDAGDGLIFAFINMDTSDAVAGRRRHYEYIADSVLSPAEPLRPNNIATRTRAL